MGQETFYELSRRSIPVSKYISTNLSWCNSVLSVLTDKGVSIFDFEYNLESLHKNINICEFTVPCPKTGPVTSIGNSRFITNEMNNYEYTEMVVDPSFRTHNDCLNKEMTNISQTAWSPSNFVDNSSLYAILNNIGGIEMYKQQGSQWKCVLNMSPFIEDCLEYKKSPKSFEELKKAVYIVETRSMCWAPNLNSNGTCFFVTAQKNNTVLFWQIYNNDKSPELLGQVQSLMTEITNMLWIPKTEDIFWLLCADILGQVKVFIIKIENSSFNLLDTVTIWEHKDRMPASHLQYTIHKKHIMFVCSKHRYVVAQVLDENCKTLSQSIKNVNDYRITDITSSSDGYYVSTVNVKIYKLILNLSEEIVNIDLIPIELKDSYSTFELSSLSFSNSDTLCVLGMVDRKLLCRKQTIKLDIIFVSTESKLMSIVPRLLSNPSQKLTFSWDSIEVLRYYIIKSKAMPNIDYQQLYEEGLYDSYKLKIYLILLIHHTTMFKMARLSTAINLPEGSIITVKEKILLLQAESILNSLIERSKCNKLSSLEKESVTGCICYIKYYSKKYETDINIDISILKLGKTCKYVCQSCDSEITEGFTCSSGHINMFCTLSFTLLNGDEYLVCKSCNTTARRDLCIDKPICVYCDQLLLAV